MTHEPTQAGSEQLERIEREFERIGLLLQHDAELPSFTRCVAGEPIPGSWWGHPLGHAIYDLLQLFAERSGQLSAKLINGKTTYVHARLWPAFLTVANTPSGNRLRGLSTTARQLLERTGGGVVLRADELRKSGFATPKEITRAIRELELRLLVHTDDLHTDSGAHAKVLKSWPAWAAAAGVAPARTSVAAAAAELERAVEMLCAGTGHKPKLSW
jgi:hypothetical protein